MSFLPLIPTLESKSSLFDNYSLQLTVCFNLTEIVLIKQQVPIPNARAVLTTSLQVILINHFIFCFYGTEFYHTVFMKT